jgi:predicted adenine nucleotide alpha hydrolase (AANH) superfamily ATPase
MKILIHVCCGPCSTAVIEQLKAEAKDNELILFFPNSNIYPKEEREKRREYAKKVSEIYDLEFIFEKYDHAGWRNLVSGLENEPQGGRRCAKCFEMNLTKTALKAKKLGIEKFTTTLTVSRFKKSPQVIKIGKEVAKKFGLNFLDYDFKKKRGYEKSIELSKKYGLYRQNYCGCEFSLR